jgi:hypothetical protein
MALDLFLRNEPDRRLARKLLVGRALFALLGVLVLLLVGAEAIGGEFGAHAAVGSSGRSRAVLRTLTWSERPFSYALAVLWYSALYLVFVVGFYFVFEKYARRWHGRPFFKRKYPY